MKRLVCLVLTGTVLLSLCRCAPARPASAQQPTPTV